MKEQKLTGYPSIDRPWMKYYSNEAVSAHLPMCSIFDYLYKSNKDYIDHIALNYFERKISYGELFDNITMTARALKQNGIKNGGIVTILMPMLPETVYLFYAFGKIGAIANMVDPRISADGICDYIQEVNSELLVVVDTVLPKINEILSKTTVKKVLVVSPEDSLLGTPKALYDSKSRSGFRVGDIYTDWKSFLAEGVLYTGAIDSKYVKNQVVAIVHTGGTTGKSKSVMLTNDNLNATVFQCQSSGLDMRREHRCLDIMPPFIAYGIGNGLHWPLVAGVEVVLIPQFNPRKFDELLLKYKPNYITGVPSHYGNIINSQKLKKENLSFLEKPIVGGDSMNPELEKKTNEFLFEHGCKSKIIKGYGMTEVAASVCACVTNGCNQIGSVGIPFTHTIISIFNPKTGEEMPYNQQGEICITGPNTMLGYYDNTDATNEIIRKHKDGLYWVHSGDIGYMTADGLLFIVDRIKRMLVRYDGFKVFPSVIEKTVTKHKAIKLCCVIGTPDSDHSQGMLPIVYLVLHEEYIGQEDLVKQELMVLCQKELPEYAQPIQWIFCESIPLTAIGKIDYRALEKSNK